MTFTPELLLALVGSGGMGAVLVALISAWSSKKRLSAEATEIITKAASGVVENVRSDNLLVRAEAEELRRRVDELERREALWSRILVHHSAWDTLAIERLSEYGVVIVGPPPLHPPE